MTEVESVPKAKLDIHEEENHIKNSCENTKEQAEVENHTAEREQDENLGKNTSLKEENRNDAEAPPPPKNPWTRHLKSNDEKGDESKLSFIFTVTSNSCFWISLCVFLSEDAGKPTVVKAAKRKGKVSDSGV